MKNISLIVLLLISFATFSQTAEVYKNRATTFIKKGDFQKAIDNLTLALKMNPKDEKALKNRAICYERIEKFDLALKDNLNLLNYNTSSETYGSIGYDYLWLEKYNESRKYLSQAISLNPEKIISRYNLALTYQYEKNYEQAIRLYEDALKISPNHKPSIISKVRCRINSNQFDLASAEIDSFFSSKNFDVEMLIMRGDIKKNKNKIEDALSDYTRAIAILPEDDEILNKVGRCLAELGFYEEEIEIRKREIEIQKRGNDSNESKAVTFAVLAIAQEAALFYEEALSSYDESLKLDNSGGEGNIYFLRCILKVKMKDFEGACKDLAKTKELKPDEAGEFDEYLENEVEFKEFVDYCNPNP